MDLLDKIEKIQKKSPEERKKILVASMIVSMSLILVIWITSLQHSMGTKDDTVKEAPKPFNLVWSNVKQSANNIIKDVQKNFENVNTYAENNESEVVGTTTQTDIIQESIGATGTSTNMKGTTTQETI